MNINHIAKKPFFDLFYRSPCMELMLRAAFHDAGTFCRDSKSGGPRGLLRFQSDLSRPENKGLQFAMDQIEDIKTDGNHITNMLSYSDLIQLGAYAAVEYTGGPTMVFRMGRQDAEESDATPEDRLPDNKEGSSGMVNKMRRMGFSTQDIVAIMGSHTLGFAHQDRTGFQGRWTQNPHVFDNTYYKEVLLGQKSKFLKTPAEHMLLENQEMKRFVEMYAQDQNLFFTHYADAHVKMSEFGQEQHLLSEFDNQPANKLPQVEGIQIGSFSDPQKY